MVVLMRYTGMIRFSAGGAYLLLVPQGRALIRDRGPFLERSGNLTGPKSYFEISSLKKTRVCSDL